MEQTWGMRIEDSTEIAAPIERLWELTVDVEGLPAITPTVHNVERLDSGPLAVGSQARLEQPGLRPLVWTVSRLDEPTYFEWGTTLGPVAMTGGHRLEPTDAGCRLTLSVDFGGFGGSLLGRMSRKKMQRTLATENAGFRAAAEQPKS